MNNIGYLLFHRLRLSFLLPFLALSIVSIGQQSFFRHLNKANGLSDQSITSFYQDELGFIWIGTRGGLNIYNGSSIKTLDLFSVGERGVGNLVVSICGNRKGDVFVGNYSGVVRYNLYSEQTTLLSDKMFPFLAYANNHLYAPHNNTIFRYSESEKEFQLLFTYTNRKVVPNYLVVENTGKMFVATDAGIFIIAGGGSVKHCFEQHNIYYIYLDRQKRLWLATVDDGLILSTDNGELIKQYQANRGEQRLSSNFVRTVCEDRQGNIWVGTQNGLNKIDCDSDQISFFPSSIRNPFGTSNSSIRALFCDNLGTIWVGSYYGGVDYFSPSSVFHHYYGTEIENLSIPVNEIAYDNRDNLWICTDNNGLIRMNRKTMSCQTFNKFNSALPTNNLKSILFDSENNCLWIGTNVFGLYRYDLLSGQIRPYSGNVGEKSLRNGFVRRMLKYGNKLYISSLYSVEVLDIRSGEITPLFDESSASHFGSISDMALSREGNLWFCTQKTIGCFDLNREKLLFSDSDSCYYSCLYVDRDNRIWVGTQNQGLIIRDSLNQNKEFYTAENINLPSNRIIGITQGNSNFITLSTAEGISFLAPSSRSLINIGNQEIPPMITINEYGLCYTPDGTLFVSGINGLYSFSEKDILEKQYFSTPILLTDLYVNNQKVYPGQDGILKQSIAFSEEIILRNRHTSFTIFFSVPDYSNTHQKLFYRLEGFDNNWIPVAGEQKVSYSNLDPGLYTLSIRNQQTNQLRKLKIRILPPFYKTWYAYLLYTLALIVTIYFVLREYSTRISLKTSLIYAEKEKEQVEELNQAKLRFFTNISHEFRTPLTLIIGQIEMLLQQHSLQYSVGSILQKSLANAYRLRGLISELIEFRKQEQGHLKLHVTEGDISTFTEEIFSSFKEMAQRRNINYRFLCSESPLPLWFDPQQLEKVFINLISNAFKHTPYFQGITISIEKEDQEWVRITVADTGKGIPAEGIEKIFNRFYQVDFGLSRSELGSGSGIGLALSKGIVEDHKGIIAVKSEEGKGTLFTIRLRQGSEHFTEEQKQQEYCSNVKQSVGEFAFPSNDDSVNNTLQTVNSNKNLPTMLVVEDNLELLELLSSIFHPFYRVHTATNGEEGLTEATRCRPDIIVSDIYMPILSGIEMCSLLKTQNETSHIPIVLLTAQGASNFVIEGLEKGADDYIVKPFDSKVLIARCNNIVNNRKRLQQQFATTVEMPVKEIAINEYDRKLLEKAIAVISENMDNPNVNVDFLARELAMSKSSLYNKFYGVTGQTPNDFILNVRLKAAAEKLLTDATLSIAAISELCGFNSSGYFIKCFKKTFGVTPLAYRSEGQNNSI